MHPGPAAFVYDYVPIHTEDALNPVRAQMVRSAGDWRRSNYRATADDERRDACFTTQWILAGFANTTNDAQLSYCNFVQAGQGQPSPRQRLKNRIELGNDAVVHDRQRQLNPEQSLKDKPNKQEQSPVKPLSSCVNREKTRDESMEQGYMSGHYTLTQVDEHFGVS